MKIAAQLYTVRDQLARGIAPVLEEIKAIGFDGVEIAGLPPESNPEEVAAILSRVGLETAGMHVPWERLNGEMESVLKEAELYKTKNLVCPIIPEDLRNRAGYQYVRRFLNEKAVENPVYRFLYHHHDFELLNQVDGMPALAYLLQDVQPELDVYWLKKAGFDPLAFLETYKHRLPAIHLKDMTADDQETFAEIGTGKIDFAPIVRWCEQSGVEWLIIEQDECPCNPLESLRLSFANLKKLFS